MILSCAMCIRRSHEEKNVGKIPTQQANKIRGNLTDQGLRKNLEW